MEKKVLFALFLGILLPFFGKSQKITSRLEKKIVKSVYKNSGMDFRLVPSLWIHYRKNGTQGVVFLDFEENDLQVLDPEKAYPVGDASSFLVAEEILELINQGQIGSLEEDINPYLPAEKRSNTAVTFDQLLSHRSGLPKIPSNFGQYELQGDPYKHYTTEHLLDFYQEYSTSMKVGSYQYSLTGFALLDYIRQSLSKTKKNEIAMDEVVGYKFGQSVTPIQYHAFSGAKGRYLRPKKWMEILQKAQQRKLPTYPTLLQKNTDVSYGRHIIKWRKNSIVVVKGAANGFTTLVAYSPDRDIFLVIVANSQDHVGSLLRAFYWFFK